MMGAGESAFSFPAVPFGRGAARLRLPPTVLFGPGTLTEIPALFSERGAGRPLVVTDPGVAATDLPGRVVDELRSAGLSPGLWDGCCSDPHDGHPEACRDRLLEGRHDAVLALGGGSVIDVSKVAAILAVHGGATRDYFGFDRTPGPGLALVAAPTTAGGGSEVSSHAVVLDRANGKKEVVAGRHLLPIAAVVDPLATLTLPAAATLDAGLDGLVHALEAFLARRAQPFTDLFVREALPRIARALPRVMADPGDLAAREELGLGGLFSGFAMAHAGAGAIHALGYPLATRYGIGHGHANAGVAVAALERIGPARPERSAELARWLGAAGAGPRLAAALPVVVEELLERLGVPAGLERHGVPEEDLPELARQATAFRPVLENSPVVLGEQALLALYRRAWPAAHRPEHATGGRR